MRLGVGARAQPVRSVVALGLGAVLALSLPPLAWWPLALLAVGSLALLCRGVSLAGGAVLGSVFGFGFMLACLWWLQVILPGAQFLVAVAEAPFFALLGLGLAASSRLPGWPLWGACCWVAMEWLRGNLPFGGLPWGRLGTAVVDTPLAAWARYGGEAGLTLVVALVSTLLAGVFVQARRVRALRVGAAALLGAASLLLPVGLQTASGQQGRSGVTVAVVQGDVPGSGLDAFFRPRVTLRNHIEVTRRLAADVRAGRVARPDVVIWPENASDIDPLLDPTAGTRIQRTVDVLGVPVVVGAVTLGASPDQLQGSGIVWRPDRAAGGGPGERYAKRRLVPFGEWVPFRAALTPLVPLLEQEIPRDFVPGQRPGVLHAGGTVVGAVMCFEVAYDAAVRAVAGGDVDVLAVQTNNAAYMGSGQLAQQWAITRLRAIETGRAVAVAATTGTSGVIAPDGDVVERTRSRAPQAIVAAVPAGQGETPGVRWGGWVEVVGSGVAVAAVLVSSLKPSGRRRRRG